jgi:preprotein translocase subunit SecA
MDHLKEGIGLRGYAQQDPLVAYKRESFEMFEAMMMRFQEDTARHLFRMQIIGPDGTPIESAEQLANAQAQVAAAAAQAQFQQELAASNPANLLPPGAPPQHTNAPAARQPTSVPVSNRAPSTTIDALEREFQKKKQRELEQARSVGSASADTNGVGPRRTGEKVGRNDKCPCGSGKKYKHCHGTDA